MSECDTVCVCVCVCDTVCVRMCVCVCTRCVIYSHCCTDELVCLLIIILYLL